MIPLSKAMEIPLQTQHLECSQFSALYPPVINVNDICDILKGRWATLRTLAHIVQPHDILALYIGHSLTLARAVPQTAIKYMVYELFRPASVTNNNLGHGLLVFPDLSETSSESLHCGHIYQ
jgi:hypothetical protein